MWEQEAKTYLQTFVDNDTIFSGNLIGLSDNGTTKTATAIVIMLDIDTGKAVEKYFYIVNKNDVYNFYELDKLPLI